VPPENNPENKSITEPADHRRPGLGTSTIVAMVERRERIGLIAWIYYGGSQIPRIDQRSIMCRRYAIQ
jgi:hypothetical protein